MVGCFALPHSKGSRVHGRPKQPISALEQVLGRKGGWSPDFHVRDIGTKHCKAKHWAILLQILKKEINRPFSKSHNVSEPRQRGWHVRWCLSAQGGVWGGVGGWGEYRWS